MNELPMPLLDIATAQPCFQNHLCLFRSQILYQGNGCRRLSSLWRSFEITEKENKFNVGKIRMWRCCGMLINAVATLEPTKCLIESNVLDDYHKLDMDINSKTPQVVEHQSSSEEDSSELDDREKLRRMRISKANKGNTPWNKGRKHSPETLRRIRERTRLAMQDPKVKMKLVNLGHAQSKETRIKIGAGVRIGWNKRREKLMLQETCHFQWQNLIADASRRGLVGEEELQWDSYKILDEQLEKEWLESVEMRKRTPRPQGSKRAPKSAEQRRKISVAIAAKWADPSYRDRVYSGLSKYHGTPIGVANPRRRPTSDSPRRISPTKKKGDLDDSTGNETKSQNQRARAKKNKVPTYKDPLASTKLEMIKNIRAQRENKKAEAITRAKVLIAEAEKAAKVLEVTATRSPLAQASLIETRKLIAEAIQSIESVETGEGDFDLENGQNLQSTSTGIVNHLAKEIDMRAEGVTSKDQIQVNGAPALASSSNGDISDFGFEDFNLQDLLNCDEEILPSSSSYDHHLDLLNGKDHLKQLDMSDFDLSQLESGHKMESSGYSEQTDKVIPNGSSRRKKLSSKKPPKSIKITKKWVCGKLVEVVDED